MSTVNFTSEQEKVALEVLSKEKHAFYDILNVQKSADSVEIKKSYRKLAIKLHPDKNPHPKAGEAFKVINRAFEVLSDDEKRSVFDRIGRDPDDRTVPGGGAGAGSGSGFEDMFFRGNGGHPFQRHPGNAMPPEDIFDFLFNMNGGGSPFGAPFGGGATTFTFGGPGGFKVYTNGGGNGNPFFQPNRSHQRRRAAQQPQNGDPAERNDVYDTFRVILPFLVLFLVPLLERLLFG
ncbi:hypothetical protein TPHA_0C04590 [Tetrapisispora phaffii CBS 4417]|uniref:J domain-containing protein n=1 Tax=Tetrapisispora phaffii (strain ATCC 24235 / CBS 4417 / NBRC 1672 / NRRL Y-8282 / UCD 70-5) TaxID=1071381 RepID=G8BQU7_TETPH|nr:hypothetical protein TPHA_0C04590 [Tetrapisispora phaffii CBS 4417]CCE62609.1 hypothetical protein TPHA_0C04590 [Tetrapisispora phaffii CBS 4417]